MLTLSSYTSCSWWTIKKPAYARFMFEQITIVMENCCWTKKITSFSSYLLLIYSFKYVSFYLVFHKKVLWHPIFYYNNTQPYCVVTMCQELLIVSGLNLLLHPHWQTWGIHIELSSVLVPVRKLRYTEVIRLAHTHIASLGTSVSFNDVQSLLYEPEGFLSVAWCLYI